jgi:hypothetical protein
MHNLLCSRVELLLDREPVTNQHSRLINAMMLVAIRKVSRLVNNITQPEISPENTNRARVQHERKGKFHRISQPALSERTKQMTMSNKDNIRGILSMHIILVSSTDFADEIINAICDLLRRSTYQDQSDTPTPV